MLNFDRCKFELHYWRYTPERNFRVCDVCQEKQVKAPGILFDSWETKRRKRRSSGDRSTKAYKVLETL